MEKQNLATLLAQANQLRFKLLAIVGKNKEKRDKIIEFLEKDNWTVVNVEEELIALRNELKDKNEINVEIGTKIKEWFSSKPDKLILINASLLYHKIFLKSSPIGAFKYKTRDKRCVLFLEDEKKLGNRLYYGEIGTDEYFEQEINDIILVDIDEIDDNLKITSIFNEPASDYVVENLSENAIGNLFNFTQIKDVIDIDNDIKELESKKNIVSSYIISESLEEQIIDFFNDLEKPTHKSRNIIGNYGSGKSHLVAFLVSLIENPELADFVKSSKTKEKIKKFKRKFFTVQFELQATQVPLRQCFF